MPEPLFIHISNVRVTSDQIRVQYTDRPLCPHCGANSPRTVFNGFFIRNTSGTSTHLNVYLQKMCPVCGRASLLEYQNNPSERVISSRLDLQRFSPNEYPINNITQTVFSDAIKQLSPNFVQIYHQSEHSEADNLSEICGMGYRKALEFLIKDYAISIYPNDKEKIEKANLSSAIKQWISSEKIKTLAERAVWLGNDETHYVRRQEDYSLTNMKSFIKACVYFIDSELAYEAASSLTPLK